MCAICGMTICSPRCPNSSAPEPSEVCRECGCDILPGESLVTMPDGKSYHYQCIWNMDVSDVLSLAGIDILEM